VLNCYIYDSVYGAIAAHKGIIQFQGENTIKDMTKTGVLAQVDSLVQFRAWSTRAQERFLTKIRTTGARDEYQAVKAVINSTVMVCDQPNDDTPQIGQLKILDEHLYQSKEYYGVVLESASRFVGAKNVVFWDAAINNGNTTVARGRRFVAPRGAGVVIAG
jgi:hypothetical protein